MITTLLISCHALLTYVTIMYGKPYIFRPSEFDIINDDNCRIAFMSAIGTLIIWLMPGVFS